MKFKYTALGAHNQKLEGVLEADNLEAAREQLHKMNLSVVAISEQTAEEEAVRERESELKKSKEGIKTYYFSALDSQRKEVNGTIDAGDPASAFRRLMMEYEFEVLDLYPEDAVDPISESLKPEFMEWKRLIEEESGGPLLKRGGIKGEMEEEKLNEEIVAEMDAFIINVKTILKDFRNQYSNVMIREIERILGELERIRASTNLKHITKLCNELYDLVSNPDAVTQEHVGEKHDEVISKIRGSGFVANSFQLLKIQNLQKRLARFDNITNLFTKIQLALQGKRKEEISSRLEQKMKSRRARWLSSLSRTLRGESLQARPTLWQVVLKLFGYLQASNIIIRRARKQEMIKAWRNYRSYRQESRIKKTAAAPTPEAMTPSEEIAKPKRDFSSFYSELDSFAGWLLFFYIAFFYLVSFSVEKNIGLPKTLVLRTLNSPLILNISIFLIVIHLAFTLKIHFFRRNLLGSLFLFFLTFGLYAILIINL